MNLQPLHLQNNIVRLLPLLENDFDNLYNVASDPLIWEQHPQKNRYQKDVFSNYFEGAIKSKGAFKIINVANDRLIGCTRFYDLSIENSEIKIGYTFYSRDCWGLLFNKNCKILMLHYAFEYIDKIIFHVGANNIRSQKAIEKLGASFIKNESIAYYGEENNLNCIYEILKKKDN